jgi:hypothetical protein
MSRPCTLCRGVGPCRTAAACYLALVAAGALVVEHLGRTEPATAAVQLATFPGSVLVAILLLHILAPAFGAEPDTTDQEPSALDLVLPFGLGSMANVLLLWGAVACTRAVVRELRRGR